MADGKVDDESVKCSGSLDSVVSIESSKLNSVGCHDNLLCPKSKCVSSDASDIKYDPLSLLCTADVEPVGTR